MSTLVNLKPSNKPTFFFWHFAGSLFINLSAYLSCTCLTIYESYLSFYLSIHLPDCIRFLFIFLCLIYLSIYLTVSHSIYNFCFLFTYPPIYLPISNLSISISISAFFYLPYRHRITNIPLRPFAHSFHSIQKLFKYTMANVIIMNMKMKDFPDFESVGENLPCYAFLLLCGYWNSIFLTYFFKDNNLIFPYGVPYTHLLKSTQGCKHIWAHTCRHLHMHKHRAIE